MVTTDLVTAILIRALVKLKHFSLPHLGKFEYVRKNAFINPKKKTLSPPLYIYRLKISDYSEENRFIDFLVTELSCTSREAKVMAEEIGHFIVQYLQSGGSLELSGIGILKAQPNGTITFENIISLESYGLFPIPFTTVKVTERKPISKKPKEKRTAKRVLRILLVYILIPLLVMGFVGSVLYTIFYPQLSELTGFKIKALDQLHKIDKKSGKVPSQVPHSTGSKPQSSNQPVTSDSLTNQDTTGQHDSIPNGESSPESTIKAPAEFHIIVQSVQGKEKAEKAAEKWKEKGFNPIILPHDEREGWYRISVYKSLSRREAQRYLHQIESQGIKDAWIYLQKK